MSNQNGHTLRPVVNAGAKLGEGPAWDARTNRLLWVDIDSHLIYSTDISDGTSDVFDAGEAIGFVAPASDGRIVGARRNDVVLFRPIKDSAPEIEVVIELEADEPRNRFNDGKADPAGRLWFGSISGGRKGEGFFYRYDPKTKQVSVIADGISCSNGLGWSPDRKTLYYTDTPQQEIWAYDYDEATGEVTNKRVHIDLRDEVGGPDGLCVDAEGNIWSAQWDGYFIFVISPEGKIIDKVSVPVQRPTCTCAGGADLSTLLVTSAGNNLDMTPDKETGIANGGLFAIEGNFKGQPTFSYAV